MLAWFKKSYAWMGATINSPYASYILCFLFYLEAIFFLPTDPILIVYCIEQQNKAITYATIALIGSVLGGMTSYLLGALLWDSCGEQIIHHPWVTYIMSPSLFYKLAHQYQEHEWTAIFIAGFTPIPYKAATLAAGFCKISFAPFVLCSIIARGARFYALALICKTWGGLVKGSVEKYFNVLLLFAVILIILTVRLFT